MSPTPAATSTEPISLRNLLAVGAFFLPLFAPAEQEICDHKHAEDGWHAFRAQKFVGLFSQQEDIAFCNDLQFLINHDFVRATHQNNANGWVSVRVYLVPDDLPGLSARLQRRPQNVLPAARRRLRALLSRVITNREIWDGIHFNKVPEHEIRIFLQKSQDSSCTLSEIYSNISSPSPMPVPGYGEIASRLLNFDDNLKGLGMRSTLYTYQRRSIAAMLQKELNSDDVPNPLYVSLSTVDSRILHLQPGTMEVLLERPFMAPCRGGILCEELGTGKTVMMIGLICATRGQISSPEPSTIESRPVLTPLSFRHFPSPEYTVARQQLGVSFRNGILQGKKKARVPSLVELLVHCARAMPRCDVPISTMGKAFERDQRILDTISNSDMGKFIRANVPFYHQSKEPRSHPGRSQRAAPSAAPRVLLLTSATLIVVPANLISQWDREILKHCDDPLRVLIVRPKTLLPSVQSLATDYDVVLMPYTKFTSESKHASVAKLYERHVCLCPEHRTVRVPICACTPIEGVSPLLRIRWKRLVIDEGHVSSSLTTSLVPFAKLLSVERRWIITGTPTTNLLGLSFGLKTVEDTGAADTPSEDSLLEADSVVPLPPSPWPKLVETKGPPVLPPANANVRQWNRWDRQDLNKLGNMITHFICVPQFHANPRLIPTHLVEPLLDITGPRGGSFDVLRQVMEMVMLRHRIEDVENDVVLPPVAQDFVLLDLDPLAVKSYNALQAVLWINAVDSQRKDRDYMFHPRNADALSNTVQNMSQILFWHIDKDKYQAPGLVPETESVIQRALDRKMPDSDVEGLRTAFYHLKIALDDPLWVQLQDLDGFGIPYSVSDLQDEISRAWSISSRSRTSNGQTTMISVDKLLHLHNLVMKRPLLNAAAIAEFGERLNEYEETQRNAHKAATAKQKNRSSHQLKDSDSDAVSVKRLAEEFSKRSSEELLQEMQNGLSDSLKKMEIGDNAEGLTQGNTVPKVSDRNWSILASSQVANMRIGQSASSKMNYIINEVKKYSKTEKFLIFSASPLSLAHVAEALKLTHVKFLHFSTQIPAHLREQVVLTFETSEMYRVFLMDLKHGARGLNLISASRVIFCEPVWQADVESQAIKRVHRIGQTRPVNVKILAICDTAEEYMVKRRNALAQRGQGKIPKLLEEKGMRDFIQNPTFITRQPILTPVPEFPLIDFPPQILQPCLEATNSEIPPLRPLPVKRPITEGPPCDNNDEPDPKRKKGSVRFA